MATALARARGLLDTALAFTAAAAVPCQPVLRVDNDVAGGIARVAIERGTDLVVMGLTSPARLGQWLFGDLVDATCRQVPCPVVVARLHGDPSGLRRILVPIKDVTAGALEQFQLAERLAAAVGGRVTLLHVTDPRHRADQRERLQEQLSRWQPGATGPGQSVPIRLVIEDRPGVESGIARAAADHDLVILRSQRRLVAGLPIPASDRIDRLVRRLKLPLLVISDPLH
jgi:nucleotide-binding universal stress UspA family protein